MRIVIKLGTSTLAHSTGLLNIKRVEHLCKVVSDLKNAGHEIVMVSSGAIGMGLGKLGLGQKREAGECFDRVLTSDPNHQNAAIYRKMTDM